MVQFQEVLMSSNSRGKSIELWRMSINCFAKLALSCSTFNIWLGLGWADRIPSQANICPSNDSSYHFQVPPLSIYLGVGAAVLRRGIWWYILYLGGCAWYFACTCTFRFQDFREVRGRGRLLSHEGRPRLDVLSCQNHCTSKIFVDALLHLI